MEFPLAMRELRRIGKSQRVYAWRTLLAICVIAVLIFQGYVYGRDVLSGEAAAERIGKLLAQTAGFFQFIIVFLMVPVLTAPLLSNEKRDGTLGLLLLADLRGGDIVLSKFATVYGEAFYLLLGTLPLVAFSSYFGGVVLSDMALQLLFLLLYAATVTFLGLLCSLMTRHPGNALFVTFLALFSWQALLFVTNIFLNYKFGYEPYLGAPFLFDWVHEINAPNLFWLPDVVVTSSLGIIFAIATIMLIPGAVYWSRRAPLLGPERPYGLSHRRLFRQSPAAPLIASHAAGFASTLHSPSIRLFTAFGLGVLALFPGIGSALIVMLICYDVASSMNYAWRSGALDDLLVTPMGGTVLARDIFFFHLRRAQLYWLGILVTTALIFVLFVNVEVIANRDVIRFSEFMAETHYLPLSGILFFLTTGFALIVVGQIYACISIACLVSALGFSARRQASIAFTAIAFLYFMSLFLATWGKIFLMKQEFFASHPWLPIVMFTSANIAIFIGAGAYAHNRFVKILGVSASARPGDFAQRANPVRRHA